MTDSPSVQLYHEAPLSELWDQKFHGRRPFLAAVKDRMREVSGVSGLRLELVLAWPLDLSPTPRLMELLKQPWRWGLDQVRLWPQLSRDEGVYLNIRSAPRFFQRLWPFLDLLEEGAPSPRLLLDLEPPLETMTALKSALQRPHRLPGLLARPDAQERDARAPYFEGIEVLKQRLGDRPEALSAAVIPAPRLLLKRLGVPIQDDQGRGLIPTMDVMAYPTMAAYLAAPFVASGRALALGAKAMTIPHRRRCQKLGASPGVILGCLSSGVMGDEPVFRRPEDLARVARSCRGFSRVGLFSLAGLMGAWRPWVDAFALALVP